MLKCDKEALRAARETARKPYKIPSQSAKRKAEIAAGTWKPKPPKPIEKKQVTIKPRSDKRTKEESLYNKVRAWYLKLFPECEAGLIGCTCEATEVHHMAGRVSWLLTYFWYFLAVCRNCHKIIEENPTEAKLKNLSFDRIPNKFNQINYKKWTILTKSKNRPQIQQTIIPGAIIP